METGIEWADATWNPVRGCVKVSDGCKFCYAEKQSRRNEKVLGYWGPKGPRVVEIHPEHEATPHRLNQKAIADRQRKRLFVCSLADFFEEYDGPMVDVNGDRVYLSLYNRLVTKATHDIKGLRPLTYDDVRVRVLEQVAKQTGVDFMFVTKRPQNIGPQLRRIAGDTTENPVSEVGRNLARRWVAGDAPRNAWLGVSVENHEVSHRIFTLAEQVDAACRFVSVEPLLDDPDIARFVQPNVERDRGVGFYEHLPTCSWDIGGGCDGHGNRTCNGEGVPPSNYFNLVIVGGESGAKGEARPCPTDVIDGLVSLCTENGVPLFVKQYGTNPTTEDGQKLLQLRHPKGQDMNEWPVSHRIQEMPVIDGTEEPWEVTT